MSESDRGLLNAIKSHMWVVSCAVAVCTLILVTVFVLTLRYVDLIEIGKMIERSKCPCTKQGQTQIHEQNVNLAAGWSREDTIRENLKRKWELEHDVRGVGSVKGTE